MKSPVKITPKVVGRSVTINSLTRDHHCSLKLFSFNSGRRQMTAAWTVLSHGRRNSRTVRQCLHTYTLTDKRPGHLLCSIVALSAYLSHWAGWVGHTDRRLDSLRGEKGRGMNCGRTCRSFSRRVVLLCEPRRLTIYNVPAVIEWE